MYSIIKNLLSVFRRFKLAALLNILGLSIAFAMFIIILMQVNYDFRFDRHDENYDKIFRLEWSSPSTLGWRWWFQRPSGERFLESSPHIVAGAMTAARPRPASIHIENDDAKRFDARHLSVFPSFFDVFTFDFVEGSANNIVVPESIIIPLSLSRKLFGRESAIGRQVVYPWKDNPQTIVAVYRDLPSNSTIGNYVFSAIAPYEDIGSTVYFRVNDVSNLPIILSNVNSEGMWILENLRFTALPDFRFVTDVENDLARKAGTTKAMLLILLSIAIGVIIIAAINFTNFNMALMPMRVKNINTQRIMGAQRNTVRLAIIVETLLFFLLSWLIALLLVLYFQTTPLANFLDADMSLTANMLIVGGTALVALLAGVIVGLYPSYYLTSFQPALSLTGNFGLSPKGKLLRNCLIGIQFIVSLSLIIFVSFMYLQNRFMQNSPLGFNKDRLITVDTWQISENRDAFISQVNALPDVEGITFSRTLFSVNPEMVDMGGFSFLGGYLNDERIRFNIFPVHYTFPSVMEIEIIGGRDFRREDHGAAGHSVFLVNETARNKFNLETGSLLLDGGSFVNVIGFTSDVRYTSFHTQVSPAAFLVFGSDMGGGQALRQAYIRIRDGANKHAVVSNINAILAELSPSDWTPPIRFLDEIIREQYENETALNRLIGLFSLLAIFISIAGVFGLVVFESVCRQREIGIRKVNGASTADILLMFNKGFFKILAICFVLAVPIGWIVVTRWLENFAYKTPMYWWLFLLAFVAVAVLVAGTVTFQNWRVANENPVKLIRR